MSEEFLLKVLKAIAKLGKTDSFALNEEIHTSYAKLHESLDCLETAGHIKTWRGQELVEARGWRPRRFIEIEPKGREYAKKGESSDSPR